MLRLAHRYRLGDEAALKLDRLLDGLAAEDDPPTTVIDPAAAVDVHLADSLSGLAVEGLRGAEHIGDLGAGAGFPGLALAAALPEARVDLIESGRRKCEVIDRLRARAELANARALIVRAEDWAHGAGAEAYGAVTARALGPLALLCEYAAPLLEPAGLLVCWKGARDREEEEACAAAAHETGLRLRDLLEVKPFAGSRARHLHVFEKVAPTPPRFPRRPGVAAKRPLGR